MGDSTARAKATTATKPKLHQQPLLSSWCCCSPTAARQNAAWFVQLTTPLSSTAASTPAWPCVAHVVSRCMVRLLAGAVRSSLPDDMSQQSHSNNHHQHKQQQAQPEDQHTLVLIQSTPQSISRHYTDHPNLDAALDAIVAAFEQQLTGRSQHLQYDSTITIAAVQRIHCAAHSLTHSPSVLVIVRYDITQLFSFVDRLPDLALLVFAPHLRAYEPHDKQWVKSAVYEHLKRQAAAP